MVVEVFNQPALSERTEKVLFSTEEGLAEVDLAYGELPFLGVLVFHDEVSPVFTCIMKGSSILNGGINLAEMFTGCAIFNLSSSRLINHFMSGIVIQVHGTGVGVVVQDVFIEL